jgi:hypothetical protein
MRSEAPAASPPDAAAHRGGRAKRQPPSKHLPAMKAKATHVINLWRQTFDYFLTTFNFIQHERPPKQILPTINYIESQPSSKLRPDPFQKFPITPNIGRNHTSL